VECYAGDRRLCIDDVVQPVVPRNFKSGVLGPAWKDKFSYPNYFAEITQCTVNLILLCVIAAEPENLVFWGGDATEPCPMAARVRFI
jgi:hypothetical protein